MAKINVVLGDIAHVKVDALITAINSGRVWFGGIDRVIQQTAGDLFHQQASDAELVDGKTVVARGDNSSTADFKNVVFVVDDLRKPLHEIVLAGLSAADDAGFGTVSLPTIRMGVMIGVVEKSPQEAVSEMAEGVSTFLAQNPKAVTDITFVVYNDPGLERLLASALTVN